MRRSDRDVLDAALRRVPGFPDLTWQVEPLEGGLTNRIYKVSPSAGPPLVARLSSSKSGLLAIDRFAECHNSDAAARAGVGPEVVACEPAEGVAFVRWIDARTFADTDLDDSANLARIVETCRQLHAGPRFANDFNMFDVQRSYVETVTANGFRMPARYLEFMPKAGQIARALAVIDVPTVPCNNDLLAANFLDDGERLWIIDFEYAGNNDPCFELGNIWSESNLEPGQLDVLVSHYYGRPRPAMVARARLLGLMAKYGWTLWASIQDASSSLDFDFWAWGLEKYERAVEEFESRAFETWLSAAAAPG
jgi:thiamine kinase-like enzyme